MTYRSLDYDLAISLLGGEEFIYAHLVKFEKPIKSLGPKPSKAAKTYRYVTDASYDITWDDGSKDVSAVNNGAQTYRAKALKSISTITESIEAKAGSLELILAATAIGTKYEASYDTTSTTITISGGETFTSIGFLEGDEVTFTTGTNAGKVLRLERFTNQNKTVHFTVTEGNAVISDNAIRVLKLTSKELSGILIEKEDPEYARYINREVYIYKAHINPSGGIIGQPFLLFKGIIASGKLTEDPTKESIVSWSVTSHWGDFENVIGRITSDDAHRAKTGKGQPDYDALIRPEYGSDLGFMHSEQAINLITTYKAMETRYRLKKRGGFAGLIGGKKLVEYQEEVDREVDLKLNLEARSLPVIYGVQKVDSIPIFVDTLENDPATVFVAYAICEGEVHSLYDVYFDDESSICLSEMDQNARQGTDSAAVLCRGRMDRGDLLEGFSVSGGAAVSTPPTFSIGSIDIPWGGLTYLAGIDPIYELPDYEFWNTPGNGATQYAAAVGLKHDQSTDFTSPINTWLTFHSGKPNQHANNLLVDTAQNQNFKLQNAYFSSNMSNYWTTAHRLLDTAYVVAKYQISEGEVQLPSLDFVVKGRLINCYNYDYSYLADSAETNVNPQNFKIGDTITLGGGASGSSTIAWITQIAQPNGDLTYKVRLTSQPALNTGRFYIQKGTDRIYLATHDALYLSTTVASVLREAVQSTSAGSTNGINVTVNNGDTSSASGSDVLRVALLSLFGFTERLSSFGTSNTTPSTTLTNIGSATTIAEPIQEVEVRNGVKLSTGSTSNDVYNGLRIKVTKTLSDGSIYEQDKLIEDYIGITRVALTDTDFHPDYLPGPGDIVVIYNSGSLQVSTNPVMQLLDYITNNRFGRSLDIDTDINLNSWKAAARKCDTRSRVRIVTTAQPTVGAVYKFENNGLKFQGTVDAVKSIPGSLYEVTFGDVIGKLCYKWNNWREYKDGDLIWSNGGVYSKTGDGTLSTAPTGASVSLVLTKVSGSGLTTLTVNTSEATFEGNPVIKEYSETLGYINGYELYDSDDVNYWRYVGWETPDQEYVTRHQTNMVVGTTNSVFENINEFLLHFNGILRYNAGRYDIDVASEKGADISVGSYVPSHITEEDIIGSINIEDSGNKATFNHASCTLIDPANKFEGRSATYLNSIYLKEDRNISKKGNVKTPGISNYFNARLNAKSFLDESRYGLSINFTMPPKGLLLLAGEIITVTNSRLEFVDKPFRITNISLNPNGLVQVNAQEHTDLAYIIDGTQTDAGGIGSVIPTPTNRTVPYPVTVLTADQLMGGGIEITWARNAGYINGRDTFELYRSTQPYFTASPAPILIATVDAISYIDNPSGDISTPKAYYYWIRVRRSQDSSNANSSTRIYSTYYPDFVNESPEPMGVRADNFFGAALTIEGDQIFKYASGASVPEPSSITLTVAFTGVSPTYLWEYYTGSAWASLSAPNTLSTYTLSPDNSAWSTDVLRIRCTSGVFSDETLIYKLRDGDSGSGQGIRSVNLYSYNLSTLTTNPFGTFNDPISGAPVGWGYNVPGLVNDGDTCYLITRIFTSDDQSPQDIEWSTPTIYSIRIDGNNAQDTRYPTIFRKGPSSTINAGSGTFADPLAGNTPTWSYSVPTLEFDGDIVYSSSRRFTSDAAPPQDANWSTPTIYAQRIDGVGIGIPGQAVRTVNLYKLNDPTLGTGSPANNTFGTFNNPLSGAEAGWGYNVPGLVIDGDTCYVTTRTFTSDGLAPQTATWSTPTIYATRKDGVDGQAVKTVNLYKLNDSALTTNTFGTFNDPISGAEAGWGYSVPGLVNDGDICYVTTRTFTSDGLAPQTSTWTAPVIYSRRIDGNDAQDTRYPSVFRLNSNSINSTSGTFADPLANNISWSYNVPSLVVDGDVVYSSSRRFTSDGLSPQDATWSTPTIYARRIDGNNAQDTRYPTIFRLNDNSISSASGTFADPLAGNTSWSYSVPNLVFDGDIVYSSSRRFTSNGLAPQDASWSTPTIYARRVDGEGIGIPGQSVRTVNLYKLNDSTLTTNTFGTFNDPISGAEAGWDYSVPGLVNDGDICYVTTRTFSSDAAPPQNATWVTPTIYARRNDGDNGQSVRTVNLYKLNDSIISPNTFGTFNDPISGAEAGWGYSVPSLVNDKDICYVTTRTFSSDGLAPQTSTWTVPTIYARREDGLPALSVILDNPAHTVPTNATGTIADFTGSGTRISAFYGTTQLEYELGSAYPGTNNLFRVTFTVSNVTSSSTSSQISPSGLDALVGNLNGMSADTGSITFSINIRVNDTNITILQKQTFSRSKAGEGGSPGSSAMNIGFRMDRLDQWFEYDTSLPLTAPWTIETVNGPIGVLGLQHVSNDITYRSFKSESITFNRLKKHRVSWWAKQTGDRSHIPFVQFFDSAGNIIALNTTPTPSNAVGWPLIGSVSHNLVHPAIVFPGVWTLYTFEFGGDALATAPASAVTLRLCGSWAGSGTTSTTLQLQDFRIAELADDGKDGISVAELLIYRRSASTLTIAPTGGSYNFGTQVLTPPTNWTSAIPAGTDPVYVSTAVAFVVGQTGVDSTLTWSVPVLVFSNGQDGQAVDMIFKRSATQPEPPGASAGVPATWFTDVNSVPAGVDPMWSSVGTRPDPNSNWTWQTPIRVEGIDGDDGVTPLSLDISPASLSVPCDYLGTPKTLSYQINVAVYLGGILVTSSSTVSVTSSGCSASVNNTTKVVTVSNFSADIGSVTITASYSGQTRVTIMPFTKVLDGVPITAIRRSFVTANFNNTTAYLTTGPTVRIYTDATGSLGATISLTWQDTQPDPMTTINYYAKLEYRVADTGNFTAWHTEVIGTSSEWVDDPWLGYITLPGSLDHTPANITGLSSNTEYEVRLLTRATLLNAYDGSGSGYFQVETL